MNRLKSFSQFNESFIEDLFRGLHGAVSKEDLQPLKKFIGKPKFPTQKDVDEAVSFLDIDPEYLFYDKTNPLNPIVYWKGPIFYGFFGGLNMDALKMTRADQYFAHKKKYMEDKLKVGDYVGLFDRVDKKILIPTFVEMYQEIPDSQKYDVFEDLYMRSEFGFGMFPQELLKDLFSKRKLSSAWKSRMQQFKKDIKLNDDGTLTVFRGEGSRSTKGGMSWTLSRKTARFFADRFGQRGKVLTKKVKPEEVLDYLKDRNEAEVLIMA